jgi:hypothetical protein
MVRLPLIQTCLGSNYAMRAVHASHNLRPVMPSGPAQQPSGEGFLRDRVKVSVRQRKDSVLEGSEKFLSAYPLSKTSEKGEALKEA